MKKNLPKQESPLSHETDLPEAITAASAADGQRTLDVLMTLLKMEEGELSGESSWRRSKMIPHHGNATSVRRSARE
jgi:hypothetical protein